MYNNWMIIYAKFFIAEYPYKLSLTMYVDNGR